MPAPSSPTPELTDDERRAIASLKRLAKRWPETLELFSWSGSLVVLKGYTMDLRLPDCIVASVEGIKNDGGDPGPF